MFDEDIALKKTNISLEPCLTLGWNHNDATSGSNFWMPRGKSGHPGGNLDDHDYDHDHQDYDNARNKIKS